ncbi:MAG: 3'-5' exonuclease [Flavobacteriales bacterium]|nr:3'-5' exonuclease [Bacteroidota bacterium]MCB9239749.1 3'-5' exonuclease [Flavobacteriales bacterium]
MSLKLNRPLIVFDLETTGIQITHDRIIDIYLIKVDPAGNETTWYKRLNPQMPIPAEATAVHGISNDDVANCPTFSDVANELNQFIGQADFGGFNSNRFDFPMLVQEFYRAGIDFETEKRKFLDAQRIFHIKEPRNLTAAYAFYCNGNLEDAHSAKADTEATWEVIKAQLNRYTDLEPTVDFLHRFSGQDELVDLAGRIRRNPQGEPIFAFGKHKGRTVRSVFEKEPSYFDWMMNGDFPENTKRVITRLRLSFKNS